MAEGQEALENEEQVEEPVAEEPDAPVEASTPLQEQRQADDYAALRDRGIDPDDALYGAELRRALGDSTWRKAALNDVLKEELGQWGVSSIDEVAQMAQYMQELQEQSEQPEDPWESLMMDEEYEGGQEYEWTTPDGRPLVLADQQQGMGGRGIDPRQIGQAFEQRIAQVRQELERQFDERLNTSIREHDSTNRFQQALQRVASEKKLSEREFEFVGRKVSGDHILGMLAAQAMGLAEESGGNLDPGQAVEEAARLLDSMGAQNARELVDKQIKSTPTTRTAPSEPVGEKKPPPKSIREAAAEDNVLGNPEVMEKIKSGEL